MEYRKAKAEDLPDIIALLKASELPDDEVTRFIPDFLVAEDKEAMAGCAGLEIYGAFALLRSVVVSPSTQGKGIGKELTKRILEYSRSRNVQEVYLLTTTARDFFAKFGFVQIERNIAPPEIRATSEFRSICPSTATLMRFMLSP